jgi:Flp pilus assembly protein TadG
MKIWEKISYFKKDVTGASMVEFVLVLPLLILISLGIYETTNYILLNQKLNEIAAGVANWVSSKTTAAEITDSMIGANLLGTKYNFATKGGVVVSGFQQQSGSSAQVLVWRQASSGVTSSIQTDANGNIISSPFSLTSEYQLIVVEVTYNYQPTFSYFAAIFPALKLSKSAQVVPRGGGTFSPLPAS